MTETLQDSKVEVPVPRTAESGTQDRLHTRAGARPRASAAADGVNTDPLSTSTMTIKEPWIGNWARARWQAAVNSSPYAGSPPSIRDRVEYTRSGGWMPGDRAVWLELFGKAYGYLFAVPTTVALYIISWWIAKPTRVLTLFILYGFIRWGS